MVVEVVVVVVVMEGQRGGFKDLDVGVREKKLELFLPVSYHYYLCVPGAGNLLIGKSTKLVL